MVIGSPVRDWGRERRHFYYRGSGMGSVIPGFARPRSVAISTGHEWSQRPIKSHPNRGPIE
ncbi:hypothetical protein ACSBR2_035159 [Camellia fascicularis]